MRLKLELNREVASVHINIFTIRLKNISILSNSRKTKSWQLTTFKWIFGFWINFFYAFWRYWFRGYFYIIMIIKFRLEVWKKFKLTKSILYFLIIREIYFILIVAPSIISTVYYSCFVKFSYSFFRCRCRKVKIFR